MIHHVVRSLKQQSYSQLTSSYHICNFRSKQFYHKLGFEDIADDEYYLRIYIGWLRNKIQRKEKLKMFDKIEEIKQEREHLQHKLFILEEEHARSIRKII